VGLLQIDGEWADISSRPSLPFLRPGRLPAPLSAHVGFGYHLVAHRRRRHPRGRRRQPRQFVYVDRPGARSS
jgi:hypothetical protein